MVARIRYHDSVAFFLALLLLINAPLESEANVRLCGVKLTRTLMAICRNQVCGGFIGNSVSKRSGDSDDDSPAHFLSLAKRSGIATECCQHRCSLAYLKTYCCTGEDYPLF
uniref:IlGF domain-containing protein n=1 Tax=Steinernema glaseri TaxID=37863 RepID=A0A1I7YB71_9BILA